jgi:hypothetical protein
MAKPSITTVATNAVPEVEEFLKAFEALEQFKLANAIFMEALGQLSAQYNAALENAEKAVRSQGVSCGPFELYNYTTRYDTQRLYEELGREDFLKVGGKLETKTEYVVDKATLEMNIARNVIPAEVVEVVVKNSPTYHKPDKVVLP